MGLVGQWFDQAWEDTRTYAAGSAIDLATAYADLADWASAREFADAAPDYLPAFRQRVKDARTVICGYFWIAGDKATDSVVNDTHSLIRDYDQSSRVFYEHVWAEAYRDVASRRPLGGQLLRCRMAVRSATTRLDKVVAVDWLMHLAHIGPAHLAWTLDELFVLPTSTFSACIWRLLDDLAWQGLTWWHS